MHELYFVLAALHIRSMAITGILWTLIDLKLVPSLKPHFRNIRAVTSVRSTWCPGLVFFSGLGYVFPRPPGLDPFYYWTKGWAMVLSMMGLAVLVFALLWTAAVLVIYAAAR
ncbi:MAG TPA: hypothetical protein VEI07_07470 [Planctomycetaceae bacterium]|nr:hypothetical protein [Planctomycetaceae bacterium]